MVIFVRFGSSFCGLYANLSEVSTVQARGTRFQDDVAVQATSQLAPHHLPRAPRGSEK